MLTMLRRLLGCLMAALAQLAMFGPQFAHPDASATRLLLEFWWFYAGGIVVVGLGTVLASDWRRS